MRKPTMEPTTTAVDTEQPSCSRSKRRREADVIDPSGDHISPLRYPRRSNNAPSQGAIRGISVSPSETAPPEHSIAPRTIAFPGHLPTPSRRACERLLDISVPSARRTRHRGWGDLADADIALARRLQAEDDGRAAQDAAISARLDELERDESMATAHQGQESQRGHRRRGRSHRRTGNFLEERGRIEDSLTEPSCRPSWFRGNGPLSFANAMAHVFGAPTNSTGGDAEGRPYASIFTELEALHQAVTGARAGALPPHLLFTDRDFTDEDYEALLALDEGVENRKGAAPEVINRSGSVERAPRVSSGATWGDCCICLEGCAGHLVRRLECSHYFHKVCVDKWLKQKGTCPVCNRQI